jgi:hypothetical protein
MTPEKIHWTAGDNNRTLYYQMRIGRDPFNLSGFTVECQLVPNRATRKAGGTTIVQAGVPAADQVASPGYVLTTFPSAKILEGTYTVEWEATDGTDIVTFPGDAGNRPILVVRPEHDVTP